MSRLSLSAAFAAVLTMGLAGLATDASAQYYGGRDRGYDRGYREAPRHERGWDHRRGYDDRRHGGRNAGMPRGWNHLTIDQQKQAIKNQRRAQKKMIQRGFVPQ